MSGKRQRLGCIREYSNYLMGVIILNVYLYFFQRFTEMIPDLYKEVKSKLYWLKFMRDF